jgi:hypothetical protein
VNKQNRINGSNIDRHPFAEDQRIDIYFKDVSVLASQAPQAGVIVTPEGEMTFQAGDYILTDNPPSHAWPVRQQVFETTYQLEKNLPTNQDPRGEVKVPREVPKMSLPPQYPAAGALPDHGAIPEPADRDEDDEVVPETREEAIARLLAEQERVSAEIAALAGEEADMDVVDPNPNLPTEGEAAVAGTQQLDDSIEAKTTPEVTQKTPAASDTKGKPDKAPKQAKKAGVADSSSLEALG